MQPLLEASRETRAVNDELRLLRLANEKLEEQLREAREALKAAEREAVHALKSQARLRKLLQPWHDTILGIYGELAEMVDDPASNIESSASTANSAMWRDRIAKAAPAEARILQTLLDGGGEMSLTQIRTAARTHGNTSNLLTKLKARNWVQQTARGSYALKGA